MALAKMIYPKFRCPLALQLTISTKKQPRHRNAVLGKHFSPKTILKNCEYLLFKTPAVFVILRQISSPFGCAYFAHHSMA